MKLTLDRLKRGQHVTIVALGDSITAETLLNCGRKNWVSLLNEGIQEKYGLGVCTTINAGIPGATYADALNRLDRDVIRFSPDLVIVALGMNDAGNGSDYLPRFEKDVRLVIEGIKSGCSSEILIMTPNPVIVESGHERNDGLAPGEVLEDERRPLAEYSRALTSTAKDAQCAIIDHYSCWKNTTLPADMTCCLEDWGHLYRLWPRMANSTHPGPLGHLALYREIAKALELAQHFVWEGR